MTLKGITILAIFVCLVSKEAAAQHPSRIGLQVELLGQLRTLCVPAGGTVAEVEKVMSAALVEHITKSGYWTQLFCWKIEPYNPANVPQGLLRIALKDVATDTEVDVTVSVGPAAVISPPFVRFKLLEGRATSYPRGQILQDIVNSRFTAVCLEAQVKEEEFHQLLRRKVPVGKGMVIHNLLVASSDPHGLVLLPWNEFNTFGQARFKFRYRSENKIVELLSEGTGLPQTVTSPSSGSPFCCLLTKHQNATPDRPLQEPVDVYLDMTCQEIMFLPPPAVPSCSSADSGPVSVPNF